MEKNSAKYIGKLLKKARIKKGLTQLEVASHFKYESSQFVHLIENGKSKVPLKILGKYCDLVNVNKQDVYNLIIEGYRIKVDRELF